MVGWSSKYELKVQWTGEACIEPDERYGLYRYEYHRVEYGRTGAGAYLRRGGEPLLL